MSVILMVDLAYVRVDGFVMLMFRPAVKEPPENFPLGIKLGLLE